MIRIAAYAALATAGALLGLQILRGFEFTAGGTIGTQASMVLAMVTQAALPVFIAAASQIKAWGLVVALGVAFVALLAYSLPATTGRTGEIKAAKVADAAAVARIRDDFDRTNATLKWAMPDMVAECGTGEGKNCRAKRNTVKALEDRAKSLQTSLASAERSAPGDVGADALAWASMGMMSPDTVRRGGIIAFALGLDVAIWALIWLATSILIGHSSDTRKDTVSKVSGHKNTVSAMDYMDVPNVSDAELEELRRILRGRRSALTNDQVAALMSVTKSEASKRVAKAVAAGIVSKHRVGREVAIALH